MFKKPNRKINTVFIYCSATDNPKHDDVKVIKRWTGRTVSRLAADRSYATQMLDNER